MGGVRQRRPLAPLLYLFAAQDLLSWLQHRDVVPDTSTVIAVQLADDTKMVLNDPEAVSLFFQFMDELSFWSASEPGQGGALGAAPLADQLLGAAPLQ